LVHPHLQILFPIGLAPSMYKLLLGIPLKTQDYETLDPNFFKAIRNIIQDGNIEDLSLSMAADIHVSSDVKENFKETSTLKINRNSENTITALFTENGENVDVTNENFFDYLRSKILFSFGESGASKSMKSFIDGFREVCPANWAGMLDPIPLVLRIEGTQDIQIDDWKKNIRVKHELENALVQRTLTLFWKIVEEFSIENRAKLLSFVTGCSRVPPGGFSCLLPQFTLSFLPFPNNQRQNQERQYPLPVSHSCFSTLELVCFQDEEVFREKLLHSIQVKDFLIK